MSDDRFEGGCLSESGIKTRDWYAWNDLMPPRPDFFHIVGMVYVPNPGVELLLVPAEPQGINPDILLLDLHLIQKPGVWPRVFVWKQARYDQKITNGYKTADILYQGNSIATVDVENVH